MWSVNNVIMVVEVIFGWIWGKLRCFFCRFRDKLSLCLVVDVYIINLEKGEKEGGMESEEESKIRERDIEGSCNLENVFIIL